MIIATPNSTRKIPLQKKLGLNHEYEVVEIEATMLNSSSVELNDPSLINKELANLIYDRKIRPPEFGCSISNNRARKLIAISKDGGIIFEDDARILDSEKLVRTARNFLSLNRSNAAVLSLFDGRSRKLKGPHRKFLKNYWVRLIGNPSLTVGYVITPLAAQQLLKANSPIKFLADWPQSRVKFYVSLETLISHGDEHTQSTISSSQNEFRNRLAIDKRLKTAFGITFFLKRNSQFSFLQFLSYSWLPKVYWYLDLFIYTLFFKSEGNQN